MIHITKLVSFGSAQDVMNLQSKDFLVCAQSNEFFISFIIFSFAFAFGFCLNVKFARKKVSL